MIGELALSKAPALPTLRPEGRDLPVPPRRAQLDGPLSSPATRTNRTDRWRHWRCLGWRLSCFFFGHHVNDLTLAGPGRDACRCGERFLGAGHALTRIRHTVSCFFLGHDYHLIAERDGHNEYLCGHCGHPLLFAPEQDPFARQAPSPTFRKRVRYFCNLLGHRVRRVAERQGLCEYACDCGHTFLKEERGADKITHPAICLFLGHYVRFVEHRHGHAEYQCTNCGHPFCFPLQAPAQTAQTAQAAQAAQAA